MRLRIGPLARSLSLSVCSALCSALSHLNWPCYVGAKVPSATLRGSSCCFLRELNRDKGTPGLGVLLTEEPEWGRGCRHWPRSWTECRKPLFRFPASQTTKKGDDRIPSGPQLGHKRSELSAQSSSFLFPCHTCWANPPGFLEHRVPGEYVLCVLACLSY